MSDVSIENDILTYNPSRDDDFYQQRNNKRYPFSSCFATSDVNMLMTAGYKDLLLSKVPKGIQPEDWITGLFEFPEVDKKSASLGIDPNEDRFWYSMHEYVLNKYVFEGDQKVYAAYNQTLQKIVFKIIQRKPPVVGGKFTHSGHMVNAVGIVTRQLDIMRVDEYSHINVEAIIYIILDDPYGNPLTNYEDVRGNNVYMPLFIFNDFTPKKHCIMLK